MYLNTYFFNINMKKVISPHVNIYKFPITAISSIATRITGLYMSGVFVVGGTYLLSGNKELIHKYEKMDNFYKKILHSSIIIPSTYHTLGGIRHFIWDKYPSLLKNNKVARSSYLIFGLAIGISGGLQKMIET